MEYCLHIAASFAEQTKRSQTLRNHKCHLALREVLLRGLPVLMRTHRFWSSYAVGSGIAALMISEAMEKDIVLSSRLTELKCNC